MSCHSWGGEPGSANVLRSGRGNSTPPSNLRWSKWSGLAILGWSNSLQCFFDYDDASRRERGSATVVSDGSVNGWSERRCAARFEG